MCNLFLPEHKETSHKNEKKSYKNYLLSKIIILIEKWFTQQ